MAHELAHYLLHFHLIGDGIDDDSAYRSTAKGNYYNRKIGTIEETEANRLAAQLLMPADLVKRKWANRGAATLQEFAKMFQVSAEAMRIRLSGLGLVPRD